MRCVCTRCCMCHCLFFKFGSTCIMGHQLSVNNALIGSYFWVLGCSCFLFFFFFSNFVRSYVTRLAKLMLMKMANSKFDGEIKMYCESRQFKKEWTEC